MHATILARIQRQRAEDLRILANQAERAGVRILVTKGGESFATDPADPTILRRLTPESCDCLHFVCFGRCGHLALFLSEIGAIEDVGAPDPDLTTLVWGDLLDDTGELPPIRIPIAVADAPTVYAAD